MHHAKNRVNEKNADRVVVLVSLHTSSLFKAPIKYTFTFSLSERSITNFIHLL